jgi:hypothetical protein
VRELVMTINEVEGVIEVIAGVEVGDDEAGA